MLALSSCKKGDDSAVADTVPYTGILTKVKLGMPLTKIVALQPQNVELYYENDTTVWGVNSDTDIMEIKSLIPEDDAFFYTDDSIITYYFQTVKGDSEMYLNGYGEEVHCLMDRTAAEQYFETKTDALVKKHCINSGDNAMGSVAGTEGMDMNLVYTQEISATSYTVTFTMTLTYDTVNDIEGYYCTKYEIKVMEKPASEKQTITLGSEETEKKAE